MRKLSVCLSSILLTLSPIVSEAAGASDQSKDDDRLRNCGTVLKEILDVPDNIPHDLLDKADCVVVFPSVLKAAFIVGGSWGGEVFDLMLAGKPRILCCLLWTRVAQGGFSPARSNWAATLPWRPGRLA